MSRQLAKRGLGAPTDISGADDDGHLVELWLDQKRSGHTRRSYGRTSMLFLMFLDDHGRELRTCRLVDLERWRASLDGSVATLAQRISCVKSLLTFAQVTGYCQLNVGAAMVAPKVPNQLAERILTVEEVFRLIAAAPNERCDALLRFLYGSGARIGETCALTWDEVHAAEEEPADGYGDAFVTLHGKGGETRHVRVSAGVHSALRALGPEGTAPGSTVFQTRSGRPLHPSDAAAMVRRAAVAAGLAAWAEGSKRRIGSGSAVSPHWLRHAHASHALDAGARVHLVQQTLGHASLATTSRYVHVRPGESSGKYLGV